MPFFQHQWKHTLLWMILAMFVDGFDGTLARWLDVKTYASAIDGALLDNIIDYLNYVVVPAFFFIEAHLLPEKVSLLGATSILLTSAYQFTQTEAKTKDHYFKGFPDYWNVMAIYMLLLGLPLWVNFAILMFCNFLIFIPIKYIYPSRTLRLRRITLLLTYLYAALGIYGLLLYPHVPQWLILASFLYVAYYIVISLWPSSFHPLSPKILQKLWSEKLTIFPVLRKFIALSEEKESEIPT
ncbi:MAG: CDP-alcohol phosphatidyltransferase family protein [Anaerolineae bacterium]